MDMTALCVEVPATIPAILMAAIILLCLSGTIGVFLVLDGVKHLPEAINTALVIFVCIFTGLIFVLVFPDQDERIKSVNAFFDRVHPLVFLSLFIGLAAYTSSILTKLREAITCAKRREKESSVVPDTESKEAKAFREETVTWAQKSSASHQEDLRWLLWGDRLLVVTGALVCFTIVLEAVSGTPCNLYYSVALGLLLSIVLYFCVLHYRQWR